jgi:hypothetical protein
MKQRSLLALLMALMFAFVVMPLHAQDDEDEEENKPTAQQSEMYRNLTKEAIINPIEIQNAMRRLTQYPSRVVGYPGADAAARYMESEYRRLGLESVRSEPFDATVPVDGGASITVSGRPFKLYSLWPNSVRTSMVGPEGITGPMIYAGSGAIGELNGKTVKDSIVLVDFNSGSEWLNGPRLGARAVVFIEPEKTMRGEAEAKFLSVPLNVPRYWVSRADAPALIAASRSATPPSVTIHATMRWEKRPAYNVVGFIPGSDPKLRDQYIVIESYYDSMSIVPSLAPGAESASGAAAQLELIKAFKRYPPKRSVMFLSTGGHFMALSGIRHFLDRHWSEIEQNSTSENFKAWLDRILPAVFHFKVREPKYQIYLFAGLDLSSHTKGIGVFYKGWFYDFREDIQSKFSDIARVFRENAEKVAQTLNLDAGERFSDAVNPISGKNWRNFIPAKPAFDAEVVTMAGGKGITFASVDDGRDLVDTPLDTLDRVNIGNLTEQTKMLVCLFWHALNDPNGQGIQKETVLPITEPSAFGKLKLQGGFASITGRVLEFDPKKDIVPNEPVLNSIAVLPSGSKSFVGVRGDQFQLVDNGDPRDPKHEASFAFHGVPPLTAYGGRATTSIAAYHLNPKNGDLDYAPDLGVTGAKFNYPLSFEVTTGEKETGVVVFRCNTTALYDLIDPSTLRTLPGIAILDAQTNGEPNKYGFDKTKPEPLVSHIEDVALIYAEPANASTGAPPTRVKVLGSAGPGAIRMVLINSTKKNPEGIGYELNGRELENTALKVAEDMYNLNDDRIQRLKKHRILNPAIYDPDKNTGLHVQGKQEIEAAEKAYAAKQWDSFDAHSRAAWGFESRAYPDVRATMNDVVKGVIFYLFLLMPFAYFAERLLIGSKFFKSQVMWTLGIFIGIFTLFRFVHPAFDITMNPMIVLLAFIMLALSLLVIVMLSGRFEKELKEFNQQISGVHRVDIGRMSVAAAAFSLGISNMRRRKARTILTCITLILLTFTVLSFTSVVPTIRFNKVPAPTPPEGPYYSGVLLRTPDWGTLEESAYRLLRDEFGSTKPVAARGWFFGTTGQGEQSFITLKRGDKRFDAKAVVGLTPAEKNILNPGARTLMAGRWFLPGDTTAAIIPKQIADALNIPLDQVGNAQFTFSGTQYTVIGVYDKDKFKTVVDLDRETLTPVDVIQMNRQNSAGKGGGAESQQGFQEYIHMEPDSTILIPFQTMINMGGTVRSIAINFVTAKEVTHVLENLMPRLGLNLYGAEGKQAYRFSTIGSSATKGGADVFIPIIIASLIVLNTMLGSVFERVKEIHIFSSIGLAPNHIAMLFIGEALVYAILGAVAGYLTGQVVAKLIIFFPQLSGLYLNFSSMSAVLTTLVVVGVVMLSTLYPARKASEVATPAIERSWRVADPVGDNWNIDMPFSVTGQQASGLNGFLSEWFQAYEEYSIGDFVTQDVQTSEHEYPYGKGYAIGLKAWLAPFDLGVSQTVYLETIPTEMAEVYELKLTLHRESGDVSNWKRINRRFLNTMRKQFLIWRTLRAEERERYSEEEESVAGTA